MKIAIDHASAAEWKRALTGNANAAFIWIDNRDEYGQPPNDTLQMAQLGVRKPMALGITTLAWLAEAHDIIVTRHPIYPAFTRYVRSLLSYCPAIFTLEPSMSDLSFSQAILTQPAMLSRLRATASTDTYLCPTYATQNITTLSQATGIAIAGDPKQDVFRWLNNQCYVRALARQASINEVPASECHNLEQLRRAMRIASLLSHPVLVKEGNCADGLKTVTPVFNRKENAAFLASFSPYADGYRISHVVETFLNKKQDVRYEFFTDSSGTVALSSAYRIAETHDIDAAYESTAPLCDEHLNDLTEAATKIGKALHETGYRGMIRVDGLIDCDDAFYPLVDLHPGNVKTLGYLALVARFKSAFAQLETHCIARHRHPITFESVHAALLHFPPASDQEGGIVIMSVKSRRRIHRENKSIRFDGRIKTVVVAPTAETLAWLLKRLSAALESYGDEDPSAKPVRLSPESANRMVSQSGPEYQ